MTSCRLGLWTFVTNVSQASVTLDTLVRIGKTKDFVRDSSVKLDDSGW